MRILEVTYEDGAVQKVGVPDNYTIPLELPAKMWLLVPTPEGATASVAFRLRNVRSLIAYDENAKP